MRRLVKVLFSLVLVMGAAVPSMAAAENARLAVLPVLVHAMDEQAYLREGLADMLASRLGQHVGIEVIRVKEADAATNDLSSAQAYGRQVGAQWVLFGSFTRFGSGASLDLLCVSVADKEAEPRAIFVQSGSLDEVIPRLGNVAERIAAYLHAGPVADATTSQESVTMQNLLRRVEILEAEVLRAESVDAP